MENKLTIMAVSGTLYEKGFQLGKRFQHTIQTLVEDTRELLKNEDIHDRFLIVKRNFCFFLNNFAIKTIMKVSVISSVLSLTKEGAST